jgi:hypothetical protein
MRRKWEYNETGHQVFIYFKKAYSVRGEALYNILIEFLLPIKLIRLTEMCLNEIYNKVHIGKNFSGPQLLEPSYMSMKASRYRKIM